MKIGIITFHWATNYGAVLQCYALQKTLKNMGHDVYIINYKPQKYDNTFWTFFRYRKFMNIRKYLKDIKKERLISSFREQYLNLTERYVSIKDLQKKNINFNALISGSDQVLNSSFLIGGESNGSTAYFLDFGENSIIKVFYAVSFGTTKYPKQLLSKVKPLVQKLSSISTREETGSKILKEITNKTISIVPDPTLLLESNNYIDIIGEYKIKPSKECFVYLLHKRYTILKDKLPSESLISSSEGIEDWINNIRKAKCIITNSFHGTIFCILFRRPFFVVLPTLENIGMNDRFYTLLTKLGLTNRMFSESEFKYSDIVQIDWNSVEHKLNEYRKVGLDFLNNSLINNIIG